MTDPSALLELARGAVTARDEYMAHVTSGAGNEPDAWRRMHVAVRSYERAANPVNVTRLIEERKALLGALRTIAVAEKDSGPPFANTYKGGFNAACAWSAGVANRALALCGEQP